MTEEDRLYRDADLTRYYDIENGWADDTAYCREMARGCGSVLDLGCGTGLLAAGMAQDGAKVTGVDPAMPMLDIARHRPGGEWVNWVTADARDVRLGEAYDLVVMTGHAFQVFLTRQDRLAVLRTIAAHLAPEGRFIFDSRNPALEEWREWTPEESGRTVTLPEGDVYAWNDVSRDEASGIVTYETHYRRADGVVDFAESRLAFASKEEIEALIAEAGLAVERWLGDWRGAEWQAGSKEIIPIGRLAKLTKI